MTQVGLTMFQYERDLDTYVAVGYTFHLCPQEFGDIDQSFIFQASTLKFLCRHNFNFNKVSLFVFIWTFDFAWIGCALSKGGGIYFILIFLILTLNIISSLFLFIVYL